MEPLTEGRFLAAILFVDMVGYSARMQEDESRAIDAVDRLWDLVRPILVKHGGREVDLAGDGMLCEFSGALAAVRCAHEIHDRLHGDQRETPEKDRVITRSAVHLGDIEHRDGRIYGDGVNIAARLLPLAPPGGTAISGHVRDQVHNAVEQRIESLGAKRLKNIKAPMEVYCLPGPDCRSADIAAARAASSDARTARRWAFGTSSFNERTLELTVGGQPVDIEKKALDVLTALLGRGDEVVTKEELIEAAWPGRVISDSALTSCVAKLRTALGADGESIKTVHGYGYRLAIPVSVQSEAREQAPQFDFGEGDHPPGRPHWRLVRHLGGGGHGEAWLATHEKTRESRVFKFARAAGHLASLKREITLSRLLRDAPDGSGRFTQVLDWNLDEPPYFLECEHCAGGSLVDWAAAQGGLAKVTMERRIEIAAQAAEALAAAHAVGVLHKDLKPANLLVEPDPLRIRLGDFGTGGVLDPERLAEHGITRMGFTRTVIDVDSDTAGTALYLAPEVIAGQPWTAQADVYALGLILFQLVVGDLSRPLAPGWERDIDDDLLREDIAAAAAGRPAQRLQGAAELVERLRTIANRREERQVQQHATEKARVQQKALERYRARRWWTAAVTVLLTISVFYWAFNETDYGKALFNAYIELWLIAEREEEQGNLTEASRLYRFIEFNEENRALLKYSFIVPPEYLIEAKLRLARVEWKRGSAPEADLVYRDAIDTTLEHFGEDSWRVVKVRTRYAEFLAGSGRPDAAMESIELAERLIQVLKVQEPMLLTPFLEGEHGGRDRVLEAYEQELAALRARLGQAPGPTENPL